MHTARPYDPLADERNAPMAPAFALALAASFGSVDRFREACVAFGAAQGAGRLLLEFRADAARLALRWSGDGTPAGAEIAVIERTKAPDWAASYERYQQAVHEASDGAGCDASELSDNATQAAVLDVRRAGVFEQAGSMLPGARWCDPARVDDWAGELPAGRPVVVYCIYGHEVGRSTALRLRAAGVDARYLVGGIDGWTSAGRPVVAKAPGAAS